MWIGEHRRTNTLLRFFRSFGKERSAGLEFVCSDMWKPYLKVVAMPRSPNPRFFLMTRLIPLGVMADYPSYP